MPSGGKAPTAPNPEYVAGLQTNATKDLFDYQNSQNRINYTNTQGSATWDKTPIFDEEGYTKAYSDWEKQYPAGQSYDANALYLAENPDVATSISGGGFGGDPYAHYMEYGKQEGRTNFWEGADPQTGRPVAPNKDDFTTYEWNATSSLNPEEQGLYDAGLSTRTGIADVLAQKSGDIFANAGPTDYSGVNPLQYSDKMSTDIYDPTMNARLSGPQNAELLGEDRLWNQQMVGDFNQGTPSYDMMTNKYNIGSYVGGPQIRDWGSLMSGLGDDVSVMGGAFDASANNAGNRANEYNNRNSSVRDWAGALSPQIQGLNNQLTGMNPWEYDQQGADAMYRTQMRYLEPAQEDTRKMLEARLGEQGFVPGTPAYNNALQEMLDSNARERDQARDKATLSGRDFGNQAFDNKSGNLQSAIKNLLGIGDLGVVGDTARDKGDIGFGELGLGYDKLGLDALLGGASTREAGGKLRLGAGQLGLDSDEARGDQAREDFTTRSKGVVDQFGIDWDLSGFNNKWANQGFADDMDVADFNMEAAGQNNADASQRLKDLISGANYNLDATDSNNDAMREFFDSNIVANTADNNALSNQATDLNNVFSTNNDITQTNNDARAQGLEEADLTQQGDLNWLMSLLQGLDPATAPDMLTTSGGNNMQAADLQEAFSQLFGADMAGYNADVSSANSNKAAIGSILAALASTISWSDSRLKREISYSGRSPKGYPWYKFRYVWDAPGTAREGVMAQDILKAGGEGVLTHPSGFYMVDYSKV